ncbi:hypothetical protein [Leifsonia sp. Leaf264]|uniref:hypothetical protein n=1 Tax=Leifsonia sp. Leaf264 TaxID=1736314 RepID=UPI0006F7B714|nr:hypothetical protein [Leifsonia sp. Leaf264]KQO98692.1 hypothetical protein ASF30_11560 [Leifsonia sp. Leaf264]
MTFVISTEIGPAPLREDGTKFPFAFITDTETVYADSLTSIVARFIPGYEDLPDSYDGDVQSFILRVEEAAKVANQLQAMIVTAAIDAGELDVRNADEDTLTALYGIRGGAFAPFTGEWEHSIPLVLTSSDYEPYTKTPVPTGEVVLIDPTDERLFLSSLEDAGLGELFMDATAA